MRPNQEYFNKNVQLSDEIARPMYNELNTLEITIDEQRKKYNEKVKSYNSITIKLPYKLFRVKLKDLYETKYDRFENKY